MKATELSASSNSSSKGRSTLHQRSFNKSLIGEHIHFTFAFIFAVNDDAGDFWCWVSWSIGDIQFSYVLAESTVADQMEQNVVIG